MPPVDPRLVAALAVQLDGWRAALDAGASRVGWKLGVGDAERIGDEIAIGHLISATRLSPGATYHAADAARLCVDAEIALQIGCDVGADADAEVAGGAIAAYGGALEVVDLGASSRTAEAVVADNVFHRAVAFGAWRTRPPGGDATARLILNGEPCAARSPPTDLADRVRAVARLLGAMGLRLQAGDRVITGSVVQEPVAPGDEVVADFGALGGVALTIAA